MDVGVAFASKVNLFLFFFLSPGKSRAEEASSRCALEPLSKRRNFRRLRFSSYTHLSAMLQRRGELDQKMIEGLELTFSNRGVIR